MPEGDTVHAVARALNASLAGRRLLRTDFRLPRFATSDLSGQLLIEVVPRGKHLLFRTDAGITVHTHFGMDGRWRLYQRGRREPVRGHEIRAVLETEAWVAVGTRLSVELIRTREEPRIVGHLGPDVLGSDWDAEVAISRLAAHPERAIGEALLDQRVMAGPGNVYKSEVLFLRGVHPWTPVAGVQDLPALVGLLKRLMEANRLTGAQVTTGDTRPGRGRWVYGRHGPCLRCGTPIRRVDQGDAPKERVTYWCPGCQPA